ncbi:EF-hand domain-containing protein [Sphingomonas sp. 37zxx]|uniref:EF-hand domain-containing protein n=1 Tax=Sphingomonas sp. 37zxx TaxID=1550073 RepID=UPI0009E0159B|nr:EF-hand domain-containing protein [Sphingomonas sp. 37zxx]
MKKFILASLLGVTALTGTAIAAQGAPAPAGQKMQRPAPPTTSAEVIQRADQMFARMDTNKDGQISQAERTAMREMAAERREANGKGPAMKKGWGRGGRGADRMLARVDTNKDGNISREEFRAQALKQFARIDTNGDGRVDATEQAAIDAKRGERREKMADRRDARATPAAPAN